VTYENIVLKGVRFKVVICENILLKYFRFKVVT